MRTDTSRRSFVTAGLAMPVAGLATGSAPVASVTQNAAPQGMVAYRTLGKTGLRVSTVGFGCMITSDASVVERAVDMGITYFDTARLYQGGNNERMVGVVLKGKRDKVVLSTKSVSKTKAEALTDLDTSLKLLGTDHVDIWYMHGKDDPKDITDELFDAWETAKQQGKIRFIGLSTHQPNAVAGRVLQAGKHEVLLSVYNFAVGTGSAVISQIVNASSGKGFSLQ